MTKRDVIRVVRDDRRRPFVLWSIGVRLEARDKHELHYGSDEELEIEQCELNTLNIKDGR